MLLAYSDNADVSRSVATILGQHVLAVQTTVLDRRPGHGRTAPRASRSAALVDVQDEARGDGVTVRVAWFDEHALGVVTDLAVGRTEGLAIIRAALDIHEQDQADAGRRTPGRR